MEWQRYLVSKIMKAEIVRGDLLDQPVEVIVNAWNRNIIPWWLLLPQGVAGAIKKHGGLQPFRELGRFGAIPLGQAVITSAGRLPYRSIIHVAGINMFWRASEKSIRGSVHNSIRLVNKNNLNSVAFPIIGAGSGSFRQSRALEIMIDELAHLDTNAKVVIVEFQKRRY